MCAYELSVLCILANCYRRDICYSAGSHSYMNTGLLACAMQKRKEEEEEKRKKEEAAAKRKAQEVFEHNFRSACMYVRVHSCKHVVFHVGWYMHIHRRACASIIDETSAVGPVLCMHEWASCTRMFAYTHIHTFIRTHACTP